MRHRNCFEGFLSLEPAAFVLVGHEEVLGEDGGAEGVAEDVEKPSSKSTSPSDQSARMTSLGRQRRAALQWMETMMTLLRPWMMDCLLARRQRSCREMSSSGMRRGASRQGDLHFFAGRIAEDAGSRMAYGGFKTAAQPSVNCF